MEPLKKEVRQAILEASEQTGPGDLEEYERLLALRYVSDPDFPAPPAHVVGGTALARREGTGDPTTSEELEARLAELHARIFPSAAAPRPHLPQPLNAGSIAAGD